MSTSPTGLPYHLVLRGGRPGVWRPMVGVLALVAGSLVVAPLLWQVPFAVYLALTGDDLVADLEQLVDFTDPTPLGLAYLFAVLASAIPLTWLVVRVVHGVRPRWLASVAPRLRWRFLLACSGLAVVALVATVAVSAVVPSSDSGVEISGRLNEVTSTTRDFVLIILLLTPLQAAGEEYAFRGYLTQAFGGLFGNRVVAVVAPAVLFALSHGLGQSIPVFFDRLAFGLVAGVLVIVTGGLEAGIAMHVLNNWLAFGVALAFGDLGSSLDPTGGSWWSIPVTLTQSLVYLGLVVLVARATGQADRTSRPVLEGVPARV